MTKKENFVTIKGILNNIGNTDFDEFLDHEVELVSRKRTASGKPTKRQTENKAIMSRILDILDAEEGMTATEIAKTLDIEGMTNQRISALLRLMGENEKGTGQVHKEMVKGKAMFTLA